MDKEVEQVIHGIQQVDNNVNNTIIPILKDTIKDYKTANTKLFIIIIIQIIALFIIITYSSYLFSVSNKKYVDFINNFEFEAEEYVYQDLDTSDNSNLTVNSGIDYNKIK